MHVYMTGIKREAIISNQTEVITEEMPDSLTLNDRKDSLNRQLETLTNLQLHYNVQFCKIFTLPIADTLKEFCISRTT